MKIFYKLTVLFFLFLFMASCNEEITLNTNFEPQIFIFGNITNNANPLKITIQESVPVENTSKDPNPVHNAKITLFTKNSNNDTSVVTNNFEENNGEYISMQIISPIIGDFYWIEVELEDGTLYKSAEEQLKPVVKIDKISKTENILRVTFKDPETDRNFYKLEVLSKNGATEMADYELTNDVLFNGNTNAYIEIGKELSGSEVSATLLNFNYTTYQFYVNITAQEEAQDGEEGGGPFQLFAPPPVHLTGNIINTTTKRKALGNFGVVSVSTLSINL